MEKIKEESRHAAALKNSAASMVFNIIQVILTFAYRTIFIRYFSVSYLGINGLFSNILSLLSLSELGITTPIIYRLYKPVAEKDFENAGKLMFFYRRVYRCIFGMIMGLGIGICPFIRYFMKDPSQIPGDVNLYVVYLLFLIQTASTYLFAYKQSLLTADKKQYISTCFNIVFTIVRYTVQMVLAAKTHNYVWILLAGIVINIFSNISVSLYTAKKYREIFAGNCNIDKEIKRQIYEDSGKTLMHRVGYKILTATDNIVISKTDGIIQTGMYSNYTMITSYLSAFIAEFLGSYSGIIGNMIAQDHKEHVHDIFKRLNFLSLWINATATVILFSYFNIFMELWIGREYCFGNFTVILLCIYFFLTNLRLIPNIFIGVSPLFTKDVLRPFIQAVINLMLSIVLSMQIGIDGVITGSIVCVTVTVFWREPYLLYRYFFGRDAKEYWFQVLLFVLPSFIVIICLKRFLQYFIIINLAQMVAAVLCTFLFIQILFVIIMHKRPEYQYYKTCICSLVMKSK